MARPDAATRSVRCVQSGSGRRICLGNGLIRPIGGPVGPVSECRPPLQHKQNAAIITAVRVACHADGMHCCSKSNWRGLPLTEPAQWAQSSQHWAGWAGSDNIGGVGVVFVAASTSRVNAPALALVAVVNMLVDRVALLLVQLRRVGTGAFARPDSRLLQFIDLQSRSQTHSGPVDPQPLLAIQIIRQHLIDLVPKRFGMVGVN